MAFPSRRRKVSHETQAVLVNNNLFEGHDSVNSQYPASMKIMLSDNLCVGNRDLARLNDWLNRFVARQQHAPQPHLQPHFANLLRYCSTFSDHNPMNTIQSLEEIGMFEALTKTSTEMELTSSHLLRLPLEIRCLIYTFVAPPTRRPGPIPWIEQRLSRTPNFDLARYREFQPPFSTRSAQKWKDGSERCGGLLSLAATNRQLYHEIRDLGLIGFPALRLGILDDQTLKYSASKEILELARQEFVRENVVAVEFFFAHKEAGPDVKKRFTENNFNLTAYFIKLDFLRGFFGKDSALLELHAKSEKHELKELIAVLATYPKIKSVKIRSDHSGFFEAWKDPKGSRAFLPLLRRGVTVEFAFDRKLYISRREASFPWI